MLRGSATMYELCIKMIFHYKWWMLYLYKKRWISYSKVQILRSKLMNFVLQMMQAGLNVWLEKWVKMMNFVSKTSNSVFKIKEFCRVKHILNRQSDALVSEVISDFDVIFGLVSVDFGLISANFGVNLNRFLKIMADFWPFLLTHQAGWGVLFKVRLTLKMLISY